MVVANGVRLNVLAVPSRRRKVAQKNQVPTVFIHGLAASSAFWHGAGANVLSVLGPCILYDLKGHGRSENPGSGYAVPDMAADLFAILDHFEFPTANIVAHSFGGMIALYAALKAPERVKSLTLADVRVRPLQKKLAIKSLDIAPGLRKRLEELGIAPGSVVSTDDGINYLNAVARIQVAAGDDANAILNALYNHPKLFKSPRNARRWIELTEDTSVVAGLKDENAFRAGDLASLEQPMMILVGGNSPMLNSARMLHRLCTHSRFMEIPDMGHFFPISNPRAFLKPTLRFLRAVARDDPRVYPQNPG